MAADAPRFAVTTGPLDAASLAGAVAEAARQQGLGPGAIRSFELIAAEAAEHWAGVAIGMHHRLGRLDIGDTSIIIVAASAHRAEAYEACRYAIERVKQIVPVWKHEHFEGGDVWIEGATARPDDADAREQALRRACV
jgi:hypothetical protein